MASTPLPRKFGKIALKRIYTYGITIGQNAVDHAVDLLAMVWVGRTYGAESLGIYSYLVSFLFVAGYFAELGIPRLIEARLGLRADRSTQEFDDILLNAYRAALATALIGIVLLIGFAGYSTAHTTVHERTAAYLIIGLTVLCRNLARVKLSCFHAEGRHELVAKLKMKREVVFLAVFWFLAALSVPPSYLLLSFLISEALLLFWTRSFLKFPTLKRLSRGLGGFIETISESHHFLLTDNALEVFLYIDFFILGIYVQDAALGQYAEASILARLFVLAAIGMKPLLRQQYLRYSTEELAESLERTVRILFYLFSAAALLFLLHFAEFLQLFFAVGGEQAVPLRVFSVITPGLLFYATVTAVEPVYEAEAKVEELQKLVVSVSLLNLILNLYLIPFAGIWGAASATMISMFTYFLLFGRGLHQRVDKLALLIAGVGVYLVCQLRQPFSLGLAVDIFLLPFAVYVVLFLMNFFEKDTRVGSGGQ